MDAKDIYMPLEKKIEILHIQNSFLIMNIHTAQNGRYKDRKGKERTKQLREIPHLLKQQIEPTH
jgi:hypothetical protein